MAVLADHCGFWSEGEAEISILGGHDKKKQYQRQVHGRRKHFTCHSSTAEDLSEHITPGKATW